MNSASMCQPLLSCVPPLVVVRVPAHDLGQARVEVDAGGEAELLVDLRGVDRIPQVVPLAVGDGPHPAPVGSAEVEQFGGQLPVGELDAAADVVDLTGAASPEHVL